MEKVLFAVDELTGLIWATAIMRPSRSTKDMDLKSIKKKYKSKNFAAGCSREVISRGAKQLGWELPKLFTMTLEAMQASEDIIEEEQGEFYMETWYYEVVSIDGDYADLKRTDIETDDLKLVARALLPAEIMEGSRLKYELMQYEIIE